jgi:hypothetical protein
MTAALRARRAGAAKSSPGSRDVALAEREAAIADLRLDLALDRLGEDPAASAISQPSTAVGVVNVLGKLTRFVHGEAVLHNQLGRQQALHGLNRASSNRPRAKLLELLRA